MKTLFDLPLLSSQSLMVDRPVVLTIGNFDGLHLGHQSVLNRVTDLAKSQDLTPAVLTFQNHPAEILRPGLKLCRICSLPHKLKLMESFGICLVSLLRFTKEISELSPKEFLTRLSQLMPIKHLVLGYDSSFGKNKSGTKEVIYTIAKDLNFDVEYMNPIYCDDTIISSSLVRSSLQAGQFEKVNRLVGREYSILSHVIQGQGQGKKIGYPTANIDVTGICLPPSGVYSVKVRYEGKLPAGIANLGVAPTLRNDVNPTLEVHLFDHYEDIYGKCIEVFFLNFIRPECRFDSIDLLKNQIANDIKTAKDLL